MRRLSCVFEKGGSNILKVIRNVSGTMPILFLKIRQESDEMDRNRCEMDVKRSEMDRNRLEMHVKRSEMDRN